MSLHPAGQASAWVFPLRLRRPFPVQELVSRRPSPRLQPCSWLTAALGGTRGPGRLLQPRRPLPAPHPGPGTSEVIRSVGSRSRVKIWRCGSPARTGQRTARQPVPWSTVLTGVAAIPETHCPEKEPQAREPRPSRVHPRCTSASHEFLASSCLPPTPDTSESVGTLSKPHTRGLPPPSLREATLCVDSDGA